MRSDPETARKLIKYLSDYFRHSLNNPSKFISLAEEMRVIDCYIQFERARFSDRLSVTYDFSEDMLENLQIPPLLLQPLVENAVIHGVIKREEGGTVRVGLIEHKTYNKIYVIDTGVGISRRKIEDTFNRPQTARPYRPHQRTPAPCFYFRRALRAPYTE